MAKSLNKLSKILKDFRGKFLKSEFMNLTFQLNKIKRFSWIRLQEMNSHGVMFRWTSEDEYQKKQRYFVTRQALR